MMIRYHCQWWRNECSYIVTDSFKHSCMILRNNIFYHYENPRVDVNLIVNKNDRSYDIDAKGRLDSEVM